MNDYSFIHALQLSDSFFPVGAFAYSDGLETAVAEGRVHDAASLGAWMDHFLTYIFVPCEGLALMKCVCALKTGDLNTVRRLDEELTAIRPARAVRNASTAIGKRLLSVRFPQQAGLLIHSNAAAAYAVVFFHSRIGDREAFLAFGYNRLAGIVSSGLRLISMGQQQGQALLTEAVDKLPDAANRTLEILDEPLRSFSPLLDIAQMNHQYVYSKLFRS
jgi:urease accessory protein